MIPLMSDVIDFASKSWKSKRLVFVFYSRVTRLFLPLTAPFTLSHLRVHVHAREFFITLPHLFLLESFFISFVQKLRRENEKEEEKKKFLKSATFFFRFRCRDEKQKGIVNKLLATCFTRDFFFAASLINCRFESDAEEICDDMKLMFHFHHKCSRGLLMIIICSLKCFFSFVIPRLLRV